ncbi:hypothetical protein QQX98_003765 [Neonectria punicea]|uniref:Peptidase S8/S53 domain-containing protein n=1 Tax=Neonectria punicea TaxID=979145 RepID=A0ABR1HCU1_9HYPO
MDYTDDLYHRWYNCPGESLEPVDRDPARHGTALTCLLLRLAPGTAVYVVRVARDSSGLEDASGIIGKDILHAIKELDVDIVSVSFGFLDEVESIGDAIVEAERIKGRKVPFFAVANNDGLNGPEIFPAFAEHVIAIRGTNHDGSFISQYNLRSRNHKAGS